MSPTSSARTRRTVAEEDGYGKFDLLSRDNETWDAARFATRCAGCDTTAVDPEAHTFSTSSFDCSSATAWCRRRHPDDISLVWFSTRHGRDPKQIIAICGQCHLRGGKSKSSGLPYPNNFVAGDDLFHDFQVDFAKVDDGSLNPGDRHIYRNARDVVRNGSAVTCLNCHKVHENSSSKHRLVLAGPICLDCHYAAGPKKNVKKFVVHSPVREY